MSSSSAPVPTETRQWTLNKYPVGDMAGDEFEMKTVPLRALEDGEVLLKHVVVALDIGMRFVNLNPTVRGYGPPLPLGSLMRGFAVGQVVASRNPAFKPGERVEGAFGWAEHSIVTPKENWKIPRGVPTELAIHMLGNSGLTAFFGCTEILKPKPGQLAVVSAAAGATGMIAAQILKIMGCKVIGIAGSDEKCKWLVNELGLDAALNRKDPPEEFLKKFAELTPNFVDLYFDNTGGFMLAAVLERIALNGRIACCGATEIYSKVDPRYPLNTLTLVSQRATMQGFLSPDYADRFPEAKQKLAGWIAEGKLKSKQFVGQGFEKLPQHFASMFEGVNTGKLVVRIAPEDSEP